MMKITTSDKVSLPPEQIGGYRILKVLPTNRGFLAVVEAGGRSVIIKPLDAACLAAASGDAAAADLHPAVRDRLARIRELASGGVANLLSVERDGEHVYLVWEHVDGVTLAEWLASAKPARVQRLLAARELVLIVESLHGAGLVHGALHARNV